MNRAFRDISNEGPTCIGRILVDLISTLGQVIAIEHASEVNTDASRDGSDSSSELYGEFGDRL